MPKAAVVAQERSRSARNWSGPAAVKPKRRSTPKWRQAAKGRSMAQKTAVTGTRKSTKRCASSATWASRKASSQGRTPVASRSTVTAAEARPRQSWTQPAATA